MMNDPTVTVLMPVYNGEAYLREAIESILNQTFMDFEFLIIDDGSTDSTVQIVRSYNDSRIRLIRNEKNIGLTPTLNRGLDLAKGKYIARMDADDISMPLRLEKQVAFMERNKDISVCGTWVEAFGEDIKTAIWRYPSSSDDLKVRLLFSNSIAHPSSMIRSECVRTKTIRYNEEYHQAQDWELWQHLSRNSKLANVPEVLLRYRIHAGSIGCLHSKEQGSSATRLRLNGLKLLRISPSELECRLHEKIFTHDYEKTRAFVTSAEKWLLKLTEANLATGVCEKNAFDEIMSQKWCEICSRMPLFGFWTLHRYYASPIQRYTKFSFMHKLKFLVKCLIRWDPSVRKDRIKNG